MSSDFISLATQSISSPNFFAPTFRSGHSLSLFLSVEQIAWRVSQNTNQVINEEKISSFNEEKVNLALFLSYNYHINILSGFGFFVGSSTGIYFLPNEYNQGRFKTGYGILLPTIAGGLALNFWSNSRFSSGLEYSGIWFPEMIIFTDKNREKNIAPLPDVYSFFINYDYFYKLNKAVSLKFGYKKISKGCLTDCSSSIYLNSLDMSANAYFLEIGNTWTISEIKL